MSPTFRCIGYRDSTLLSSIQPPETYLQQERVAAMLQLPATAMGLSWGISQWGSFIA